MKRIIIALCIAARLGAQPTYATITGPVYLPGDGTPYTGNDGTATKVISGCKVTVPPSPAGIQAAVSEDMWPRVAELLGYTDMNAFGNYMASIRRPADWQDWAWI